MSAHFDTHRPVVMGMDWMVTADHPLAARAGAEVLEKGGNAVDAAVAANLVMTAVRPHMCGIGGDLFALIYMAEKQSFDALNASGRAPALATLDWYREQGYSKIPEDGLLTCTVPGAIKGWQAALEKHGTMGLDSLLPAAIHYAEKGFPMYAELVGAISERASVMQKSPGMAELFLPGGKAPAVGSVLKQPKLAQSYRLLAEQGPDAFYNGPMGRALADHFKAEGGLIREEDLAAHAITWEVPLRTGYRGYEICTQPPNSQGIALLLQANILENFDIGSYDPQDPELLHIMLESKKLAFADRDRYVCDPAFHPVPISEMLDKASAKAQAARIDPAKAAEAYEPRNFTMGGDDTIYLTVVDGQGNSVALIQSLYQAFGSCAMVPSTGMILHNRGRGFSLDPQHPNRLEPGKRPYHTLHPAMILKDNKPRWVLGTPGADGQTQSVIQMTTNLIDHGADVQQTNEAPRWRSEPDGTLKMEARFAQKTLDALKAKGHKVEVVDKYDGVMGSSHTIFLDPETGVRHGGVDPRRNAYAIGK